MTNVYSFDGVMVFALLMICTCAYLRRIKKLKEYLFSDNSGIPGVFYKASVIGIRLHVPVALSCVLMATYILVLS